MQTVVEEILSGNTDRFRVIVQEHREELLRMAFHLLQDWDEAQDVTQATFIACFQHLRKYDPSRPFRPWLLSIHWNRCRTAVRKQQRRRFLFAPVDEEGPAVDPQDAGDQGLILREIHRLPLKQRAAFVLVEIENFSPQEAAKMLRCADSTLRVHLARAKHRLRERLLLHGIGYAPIR